MITKYKNDVEAVLKSQVHSLDYKNNVDKSKAIINDWVANCTNGNIKRLLNDFDSDTVCVLVSCVYFKGEWQDKCKSYNIFNAQLYCSETRTSTLKMIKQEKTICIIPLMKNHLSVGRSRIKTKILIWL